MLISWQKIIQIKIFGALYLDLSVAYPYLRCLFIFGLLYIYIWVSVYYI